MQIRVKCNCGEGNCAEWGVVELQGVVEPQPGFQGSLANFQIGTLCRPSSQVTAILFSIFLVSIYKAWTPKTRHWHVGIDNY